MRALLHRTTSASMKEKYDGFVETLFTRLKNLPLCDYNSYTIWYLYQNSSLSSVHHMFTVTKQFVCFLLFNCV